jgi:hypothetical protein
MMDKIRTISIKHERLRKIRNNLRYVIRTTAFDKRKELREQLSTFRQKKYKGEITEEEFWRLRREISRKGDPLIQALNKSICKCSICHSYISDMIYIPRFEKWYCVDCAEENGWAKEPELIAKLDMSHSDIEHFLDRLRKRGLCKHDYRYSRMILSAMGVLGEQQEAFLELCGLYGGYCDCEILMNAAPKLRTLFP